MRCSCGIALVSDEEFFSGVCVICQAQPFAYSGEFHLIEPIPMPAVPNAVPVISEEVPAAAEKKTPTFADLLDRIEQELYSISPMKKAMKKKIPAPMPKPVQEVVVVQESPYPIYDCRHKNARKFIEWLRDVKDVRFGVRLNGRNETMLFKTNRDVANFILGFNVSEEFAQPVGLMPY